MQTICSTDLVHGHVNVDSMSLVPFHGRDYLPTRVFPRRAQHVAVASVAYFCACHVPPVAGPPMDLLALHCAYSCSTGDVALAPKVGHLVYEVAMVVALVSALGLGLVGLKVAAVGTVGHATVR